MLLRGRKFNRVCNASGARGFFGEGYWFHQYLKPFGLNYHDSTFISKTCTLYPKAGNLNLDGYCSTELFPSCVKVFPAYGNVVNAVGLSNPGVEKLLEEGCWQERKGNFLLSFSPQGQEKEERLRQSKEFALYLKNYLPTFKGFIGLEVNFTCPNSEYVKLEEVKSILSALSILDRPLLAKINHSYPIDFVLDLENLPELDGISVTNSIPWISKKEVECKKAFGRVNSPLEELGGGGVSGKVLLEDTLKMVSRLRHRGFSKVICGGGGILNLDDGQKMFDMGADGIQLGSISLVRPWRVSEIAQKLA